MNTHHARVRFGKHEGELLTRVPYSYLRWAVANRVEGPVELASGCAVSMYEAALSEITRRGERLEGIELSAHAIDRLSLRYIDKWRLTSAQTGEGLYTWMQRKGLEAWSRRTFPGAKLPEDHVWKIEYEGITWVIQLLAVPVVKTVE